MLSASTEEKRALLSVFGRTASPGTLEACNLSVSAVSALSQVALVDAWTDPSLDNAQSLIKTAFKSKTAVQVSTSLTSTTPSRVMPCKVDFPTVSSAFTGSCSPTGESVDIALGTVDLCDQMASAYGCEVADLSGETVKIEANIAYNDASSCKLANPAVALSGTISRVCRMPVVPSACAEMALCYEATGGTTRDSVKSPYLGTELLPISGDLKCSAGARSSAIALDVNAELPSGSAERLKGGAIAAECAANLGVIRNSSSPTLANFGDGLKTAFVGAKCVEASRYYYAIGLATDSDRRRADDPNAPVSPLASAMSNRLIERWLGLHAFVAREAAEAERMGQVFRGGGLPSDPVVQPVAEALDQSLAGWQLLLHPRFATALDQMPASVLVSPDYRPVAAGQAVSSQPYHDQTDAVPVTMLETIQAQLALAEVMTEEAALKADPKAYETLARVVHHALVVRSLAADMTARAKTYATANNLPTPSWLPKYQALVKSSQVLLQRVLVQVNAVRTGENPLGISAQDTPLYFFGDEASSTTRFSAVSDFLIGKAGSDAWAPTMVSRSLSAMTDARVAWIAKRDRELAVLRSDGATEEYLDTIRYRAGAGVWETCGAPATLGTNQIIEQWTPFDPSTCYIRSELPACQLDRAAYSALMTLTDLKYQICVVQSLRKKHPNTVGFVDSRLNVIADGLDKWASPNFPANCADGTKACLTCKIDGKDYNEPMSPGRFLFLQGFTEAYSSDYFAAQNACAATYPTAKTKLPSLDELPNHPGTRVECLTGALGAGVLEVRATQKDLEIARSEFAELKDQYQIAMKSCIIQNAGGDELAAAQTGLAATMTALGAVKLVCDITSTVASEAKDCLGTLAGVDGLAAAGSGGTNVYLGAAACVAGGIVAVANSASLGLQYAMDTVDQWHQVNILQIQNRTAFKQCINDAEMNLVGMRTATLRIERAGMDVEAAMYRQREMMVAVGGTYDEGNSAVAAAKGRSVAPMNHDLWVNEKIDTFLADMRMARRVMFLAVRAVEYETQQSMNLEGTVLAASHPNQLQSALDELWATAATRGVGGKRPTDLKVVLSLRDQLLQLADKTGIPTGEQNLSQKERFRLMLRAPRYSVYDATGAYKGQRIPFEIAPLQAAGLGKVDGIPVLSSNDCAERLWSVNASIIGNPNMYSGTAPSFARVDLLKQNTFFSQWCGKSDGTYQVASVRPSRNLFRDPELGGTLGNTTGGTGEASEYTSARIEAHFNVTRVEFEADDYANGQTSELAARGLYGKYALFIPAEMLSINGGNGLILNKIDDVLLRLDYVSVAH